MKQQSNGFSIASMVLGIVGLLLGCVIIGFIPSLIGLVFGIVALAKGYSGKGMAIAGVVCSALGILLSAVVLFASGTSTKSGTTDGSVSAGASVSSSMASTTDSAGTLADMIDTDFYTCEYENFGYDYVALVLTNRSNETVHLEANFVAKDKSGNNVGASSSSTEAVAPGQPVCLWTIFDSSDNAASFDYTLTVSRETTYDSIYGDVTFDYNTTDSKCVITATNISEDTALFPCATTIFLKDGSMVYLDETYVNDDDFELKPGASITSETECYVEFDDVIVTLSGRE